MSYAQDLMEKRGLTRCPLCPNRNPVIGTDGPPNAECLFVGERPGKEENNRGRPFVGYYSKDFNQMLLPLAGVNRDTVGFTNACKCYGDEDTKGAKFKDILASCTDYHLRREIRERKPRVIITMGGTATNLVEGLNLEMHHGIPQPGIQWAGVPVTVFPTYHPAAGMHNTPLIGTLRDDFTALGKYLRGELVPPVDEYPNPDYRLLTGEREVEEIFHDTERPVAIDTEGVPRPGKFAFDIFCLTASNHPGTGYMVRATDHPGIRAFRGYLSRHRGSVVFHNGMFDIPILSQVGVQIPMRRFDDTMVRAYHLQNQPQGLKMLAYRLCGMYMEEFEDVVLPYSIHVMLWYMMDLAMEDWPIPDQQVQWNSKENTFKLYKPQGLNRKVHRLLGDFVKNPTHEVFKRWDDWDTDEKLPAIRKYGNLPKPSVAHVPIEKLQWYACRDADATLRVRAKLIELKRLVRRTV